MATVPGLASLQFHCAQATQLPLAMALLCVYQFSKMLSAYHGQHTLLGVGNKAKKIWVHLPPALMRVTVSPVCVWVGGADGKHKQVDEVSAKKLRSKINQDREM